MKIFCRICSFGLERAASPKGRLFLTVMSFLVLSGCGIKQKEILPDPAFSKYISSFTSGEVSVESPVKIQLAESPPGFVSGDVLPPAILRLDPATVGSTVLEPGGVVRFIPERNLSPGVTYVVSFSLGKLLEVPSTFDKFRFSFRTMPQDFTISGDGLVSGAALGSAGYLYSGIVSTADAADPGSVEKVVEVTHQGRPKKLTWIHSPDRRLHTFTADSLMREKSTSSELMIRWNGQPLSVQKKGNKTIRVPAEDEFTVLSVNAVTSPEQQVVILFSDPLEMGQPIEGMAELSNSVKTSWQIDGNRLVLWPSEKITGESAVTIFRGLRSAGGRSLPETTQYDLFFKNLNPEVRLLGSGVIVPEEGTLSLPFEAVSLKSVDLRVIKIFPSNIRQFLQENQVDGESDLMKVGRLVYSGKVDLNPGDPEKLHRWNTYRVDLNRYLTPEQGAMYRVELRFHRAYALTDCGEVAVEEEPFENAGEDEDWDSPGWYSMYYWPEGYRWGEKENPCHNSYYNSSRFVARNILASDLGMLAKEGKGFRFTFVITNLKTALPEDEAEILLYSYQHQLLGKTFTGKDGTATITLEQKPFVALARKGGQTGYLRLDDGSSLSLSNFDVSGEEVLEGVKGFLYGERGVWRPGDKIFMTFVLDDPDDRMPANIPVIFRLVNSRGQEAVRLVSTVSENGFYHFPVTTRSDDPTGNWYAQVRVGGALFEKRIKIEAVKPNRLKIDLQLPDPIRAGIRQDARLKSSWLHGAVARSLKAVVEAEMVPVKTLFKGYEKYSFDNPGAVYFPSKRVIFEENLNEEGQSSIPLEFPAITNAPGMMKAWFTSRVFEQGGDFSIFVKEARFSPYGKYLGIRMPDEEDGWFTTGETYRPELVALSPEGKPLPLGKTEVSLYKIDWRWWWESGEDHLARYVSGRHYQPLKTWQLKSGESRVQFDLRVDFRDWHDNGRYLLYARDMENGHATGVTFYMSQWGGWRSDAVPEGATMLAVTTDKEKYSPGEKIRVTLPSSAGGRALVSLEDGKQVRDIFWVKTGENQTRFDVEVKPGMAPTLYIHVTLIQPYGTLKNDAPIRLYGIQAVEITDPGTLLDPVIAMKEELEPEKDFTVTVKESQGKGMTYTLAIVDEGLLDLTGFKTPDPHAHFFAREALGVKTYDLFDKVAGAYGAHLEKAFAVGGDEELKVTGHRQANRFQPVVLFAGPFTLAKRETKSHQFRMPNYVGSVKAMVIAGDGRAYGSTSKSASVRKAVMLLATLPRVAGPGEEISLPVEVFAMKEGAREVTLRVETNDLISVVGEASDRVTFAGPGDKMVWFRLRTAEKTGIARVKVSAVSGGETAYAETELQLRNPNPPLVRQQGRLLDPGTQWDAELPLPGMAGTNEAFVEISSIPGMHLSKHLDALISYPHGCSEQTVSAGFCQLYLENLVQLTEAEKARTGENIRKTIQQLTHLQTAGGGIAYWPGQNASDDWSTSYAGHFMTLAARKGYAVPAAWRSGWLSFQQSRARIWKPATDADPFVQKQEALIQAYRLYTMALAGSPDHGVMNRFREEVKPYPQARWRLAAAYLIAGHPAAADQLLQQLQPGAEPYPCHGATFGSHLRDKAMILETLLLKNDRPRAFALLTEIAGEIGKSEWLSTQTAAWCFYSAARFFDDLPPEGMMDASVTIAGKEEKILSALPMVKLQIPENKVAKASAMVKNNGKSPLFARLAVRGTPMQDTAGTIMNDLRIKALFTDRKGAVVNPASLTRGTDLFLEVTVTHPGFRGPYRELALTAIFPPGWEILNSRLNDIPAGPSQNFDYQDIRDDRIYTYFSLDNGTGKTFRFALNASYEGRFFLPAIVCEGMYDQTVYARLPGQWVTVLK